MMRVLRYRKKDTGGFTIIEVVVSLLVVGVFAAVIFRLFILQADVGTRWLQFEKAEQIAYNNLDKYARYVATQTNNCNDYPTSNAELTLLSQTTQPTGFTSSVTEEVVSSMPYGCSTTKISDGYPIKVLSSVTYGPDSRKITHATYINVGG